MRVVAFNGSPRRQGNTAILLHELLRGAKDAGADAEEIIAGDLRLHYCRGCLRCNLLKRCALRGDDWDEVSRKIISADVLVFASPIYFHHLTASLKILLDRFRSFIHVQITESGLKHTPWHAWRKKFILLLCMGSSDAADARPVIELFSFITKILGPENRLHAVTGTRLAVPKQVLMPEDELRTLYEKLQLPARLAEADCRRNQDLVAQCYEEGRSLMA